MLNLLPRDTVFFDLFESLSENVVFAARELQSMAHSFPAIDVHAQRIRDLEHGADAIVHRCLERLDRTFITPFDREDIHALVQELDDIVDGIDFLAKRFSLYHIKAVEQAFQKQTDILVQAVTTLEAAVRRLRKSRKLADIAGEIKAIGQLEKQGDAINHEAVSHLFEDGVDCIEVLKWKEFYDRIEKAIDRCEDVANTLERILLKNG
jgi:predicted phosphate transport protein (TIGR00153 family)